MPTDKTARLVPVLLVVIGVIAGGVAVAVTAEARVMAPLRLPAHYSWAVLLEEAEAMDECAECHETEQFHTCASCHDDHGAVEMEDIPFYAVIELTGDVPAPGYVLIDDVLPYRDQPHTYVGLLAFLEEQGVTDLESVSLGSRDGGFITIDRSNLGPTSLLMPYQDGVRFADENLHGSTWLKGITRIIVVGGETPLEIDGQPTSLGRLLLGPLRSVTTERSEVMLKSADDGQVRSAQTASRLDGAPIEAVVANPAFAVLTVHDADGQTHTLDAEEAQGAVLASVQGQVTLVLPKRGRPRWIANVVEMISE